MEKIQMKLKDIVSGIRRSLSKAWPDRIRTHISYFAPLPIVGTLYGVYILLRLEGFWLHIATLATSLLAFYILTAIFEATPSKLEKSYKKEIKCIKERKDKEIEDIRERKNGELEAMSDGIRKVTEIWGTNHSYERVVFHYYIEENGENDRWTREYTLLADKTVYVDGNINFGATNTEAEAINSWGDLEIEPKVLSRAEREESDEEIVIIPRYHEDNPYRWWADLFFLPKIEPNEKVEF